MKKMLLLLALQSLASFALAAPAALETWKPWLREKHPDIDCPRIALQLEQKRCAWPGKLLLTVTDSGGQFAQEWRVDGKSLLLLPGDSEHWPLDVTVNGKAVAVLENERQPALSLDAGNYSIRGNFSWSALPQALAIPVNTGLLEVSRNGKAIAQPTLDADGKLWLKAREQTQDASAGDAVKVEVFRKIEDDIPRRLRTVLRLSVAGKPREIVLGRFLLKDSEPLNFVAQLPARIESDGRVRVQARAGEWLLAADARLLGDSNQFRIERLDETWPVQELWSFAAEPSLRRVKVSGAATVDPSQVDLPDDFRGLPTYLLETNTELKLEQQYRGDATPAANELSLQKTIWLDFNGDGATVRDVMRGAMYQGWRLETQPGQTLGRVTVNNEPQLITQVAKTAAGVEIRDPQVNLDAVSRVDTIAQLTATGWRADFKNAQISLRLPPGWKLWHAAGPDVVRNSWLSQWNLWNIFLALLLVGSVFRLLDWRWATLAAVTVALAYHENDSPVLYWIPLLVILALLKVLGASKLHTFIARVGYIFSMILIIVLLGFAVEQIRIAIYPQLEQPTISYEAAQPQDKVTSMDMVAPASVPTSALSLEAGYSSLAQPKVAPRQRYQPNNNVQTGPGIPSWAWHAATLQWSGPVKADQTLALYVTGPWLTRILKILDVIFATLLTFGILHALWQAKKIGAINKLDSAVNHVANISGAASALLLVGAMSLLPSQQVQAQEFPPQYLLDELEARLNKPLDCAPNCAALDAVQVQVSGDVLTIRLRVSAGGALGFPLPIVSNWQPRSVLVDGAPGRAVLRDEQSLLVPLAAGHHDVVLEAPLLGDDANIQFALIPHHVSASADNWDIFGVVDNRLGANTLQLQKRERATQRDTLLQAPAKPFLRVERRIDMDLDWSVTTTVTRVAPEQGAINAVIPLLPNEAVISPGVEAKEGSVAVSLGSQQQQFEWRSVLKPAAQIQFAAVENNVWVESWIVAPSPRWHVSSTGLTPVKSERSVGAQWRWQPWPGEKLIIDAVQPAAVAGATTTVENALVKLLPGKRSSDLQVLLEINSSVGGDYRVQLSEAAELKNVAVNGIDVSQSRSDDKIVLPLNPGANHVELHWELARGIQILTRTPALTLDTIGSNNTLTLTLPQDRWPLWVSGPHLGPALLYWGVVLVIIAVAIALGELTRRRQLSIPLPSWQWLLLGIGMSTVTVIGSLPVVLWFFALEARRDLPLPKTRIRYNALQVGFVLLSAIALFSLFSTIPRSLLSTPDMQISGNGSYNYFYQWYQDRSAQQLPQAFVISLPLWVYRLVMLLWSLWLVFALLRWVKWGWQIFARDGLWIGAPITAAHTHSSPSITNDASNVGK